MPDVFNSDSAPQNHNYDAQSVVSYGHKFFSYQFDHSSLHGE